MSIDVILNHAIIQIISDDRRSEDEIACALDGQGCVVRRARPGLRLDITNPCDVGVIAVRRGCGWSAGVITELRSSEIACATVVVLGAGGEPDIAQSLRGGAVDCLVSPVPRTVLLESLANAITCSLRWRGRLSAATGRSTMPHPTPALTPSHALVFEPQRNAAADAEPEPEPQRIEEIVHRLAGENQLTPREREVLYWLFQGHRYQDIATVLNVTSRTAKFHAANLLRKLELDSRYELPRLLTTEA